MGAARPVVTVQTATGDDSTKQVELPAVFLAPIRPDIVNFVHTSMNKNKRQAYAVNKDAGPCRRPHPSCPWWWYPPCWSGCLRQHVPWRPHVQPDQDLEEVAPQDQHQPEEVRRVLRPGCVCASLAGH